MKRQSSEGRSTASTKANHGHHQRNNSGIVTSNRSNEAHQIPGAKKIISLSRNTNRNGPIKVISREISPSHYSVQKTEPCESVSQRLDSSMHEIENRGPKSSKSQRVPTSLRAISDQQLNEFGLKKPLSAADMKGLKDLKMKKTVSLNINVGMANKASPIGPKSASHASGQFQFFEKNKTEISEAIFERDEIDEEDKRDHYNYRPTPELKVASADQTLISSPFQRDNRLMSQESGDSPLILKKENSSNLSNFRLENSMVADPMTSGLNIEFDKSTPKSKNSVYNRGTFMNEHITFSEFEKQKEKKRLMKESLDFQLHEKKRKQEEQKLKEREEALKEEARIHREMVQLNQQYEKESAIEQSKKLKLKTEEIENTFANQSNNKMTPANKQTEKPEKYSSGSEKNDTRETGTSSSGNRLYRSPSKEEEKILKSPVKVQRNTSRQNNIIDSPPKFIDSLADENKKLRDENTKKGELIDALITALKQKDVGSTQNVPERTGKFGQSREGINFPPSKVLRPLDIAEPEVDPYAYTFSGYNQSKAKYRVASEQPSEANRYNTGESIRPITEDRLPISIYDRMESKEYQPKLARPVMPEFLVEFTNAHGAGRDNAPYFKPPNAAGLRNPDITSFFGNSGTRGYSSPLANPLSQSNILSPVHKNDARSSPLLPSFFTPNSNHLGMGNLTLEPIKAMSQSSATSPKGGYVLTNPLVSPTSSTLVRIKKRQEHSVDIAELNRENHQAVRPAFIHEDGSFSLIRPNRTHKREVSGLSYSSVAYGGQSHKIEMIDTYQSPLEDKNTSATLETIHESESNMNIQPRVLGKVIFSGNGPHKKISAGHAKDKWATPDSSSLRRNQEELIEKMKALPALEGKPKFPKDVFSLNIKKKACP